MNRMAVNGTTIYREPCHLPLAGAAWLRFVMGRGPLRVWHLTINGGLYASYLAIAMT